MAKRETIALAFTGASGLQYGFSLLQQLLAADKRVLLMVSEPARQVAHLDMGIDLPRSTQAIKHYFCAKNPAYERLLFVYGQQDWRSPLASGSGDWDKLVICPCTAKTLAAVANGIGDNLIHRSAEVALKERRQLLIVYRETPYSTIQLQNMLNLSRAGALIMSANPGFYHRPQSVQDIIDFVVAKVLDQLKIEHSLLPCWGGEFNDL